MITQNFMEETLHCNQNINHTKVNFSGAGTGTAWQHDPRELPDGTISIFDNGASPKVHRQSRAVIVGSALPGDSLPRFVSREATGRKLICVEVTPKPG